MSRLMDALAARSAPVTASTPDSCANLAEFARNVILLPDSLGGLVSQEIILMAAIDWQAAVTALDCGLLPCSSGERHVLKRLPASPPELPSASATP